MPEHHRWIEPRFAFDPRLDQSMRVLDPMVIAAGHDDRPQARISEPMGGME